MRVELFKVLLALCLLPANVAAESVLFCFPGGPGSTVDAQPIVDRFSVRLGELAQWKEMKGAYYNDMASCTKAFNDITPAVVMLPLDLYLGHRAAWKLHPVAELRNKDVALRYHLYARKGVTLQSIKGQTVSTNLKAGSRFLGRIAFGGQVDVEKDFSLQRSRSAKRAIKNLIKGKVSAALIDDSQLKSFTGLPLTKDLVAIHSGPELPGAIVAGVGKEPKGLFAALGKLCKSDAALCNEMRISAFVKADAARLSTLQRTLED